jgi:hypothetical protein
LKNGSYNLYTQAFGEGAGYLQNLRNERMIHDTLKKNAIKKSGQDPLPSKVLRLRRHQQPMCHGARKNHYNTGNGF